MEDLHICRFQWYVQTGHFPDPGCCQVLLNLASHGFVQVHAEVVVAELALNSSIPVAACTTATGHALQAVKSAARTIGVLVTAVTVHPLAGV